MSHKIRFYLTASVSAIVVLGALFGGVYWASQLKPSFYRQALEQEPTAAKQGSDALLHQAADLASDLHRSGQWRALFTADQINGWIACDVRQNHPRMFPSTITDPRIAIENNQTHIAFGWHKAGFSTIVSLEAEIFLHQTNVVAIRIARARAGVLPLPLAGLLNDLTDAGHEIGLQIDQELVDGDPVLLVTLPASDSVRNPAQQFSLDSLEVNDGEIYVAGHTGQTIPVGNHEIGDARQNSSPQRTEPQAKASDEKSNIQR